MAAVLALYNIFSYLYSFENRILLPISLHTAHVTTNNPLVSYGHFVSTNQRTVYFCVSPPIQKCILFTYRNIPLKAII